MLRDTSPAIDEPAPDGSPCDLGVLVVGATGDKKPGETLTSFCTPLVDWVHAWLRHGARAKVADKKQGDATGPVPVSGSVSFSDAALRPPSLPKETPPYATLEIHTSHGDGPSTHQRWLLAESTWSDHTLSPVLVPFLGWLLTRGSWLLLLQLHERFGPDFSDWSKKAESPRKLENLQAFVALIKVPVIMAVWLGCACALLACWLGAAAIAVIPLGRLRKAFYGVLVQVTGVVGHSYVLLTDPIQEAAVGRTNRHALQWLSRRCRKLTIIAHSQGAAVAHRLLRDGTSPPVDLFVSVGSGIAKIELLRYQQDNDEGVFKYCALSAPLAALAWLAYWRLSALGFTGVKLWSPVLIMAIVAMSMALATYASILHALSAFRRGPAAERLRLAPEHRARTSWIDIHSTHDPVPNGPVTRLLPAGGGDFGEALASSQEKITAAQVTVAASAVRDHTTYWDSRCDFLPRLVAMLDACTGKRILGDSEPPPLASLREVFQRDARFILSNVFRANTLAWLILVFCMLPLGGLLPGHIETIGAASGLRAVMERAPLETISSVPGALDVLLGRTIAFMTGGDASAVVASPMTKQVVTRSLLALAFALTLAVWGAGLRAVWKGHVELLIASCFRPRRSRRTSFVVAVARATLVVAGIAPLLFVSLFIFSPHLLGERQVGEGLAFVGVLLTLAFLGLMAVFLCLHAETELPREVKRIRVDRMKGLKHRPKEYPGIWNIPFAAVAFVGLPWVWLKQTSLGPWNGQYVWVAVFGFLACKTIVMLIKEGRTGEGRWVWWACTALILAAGGGAFLTVRHFAADFVDAVSCGLAAVFVAWVLLRMVFAAVLPLEPDPATEPVKATVPS
jgi:hypothetical protein